MMDLLDDLSLGNYRRLGLPNSMRLVGRGVVGIDDDGMFDVDVGDLRLVVVVMG
jgi:hypothetical protein